MTGVEEAALAFEILSAGISQMAQGDIQYTGPTSDVGVTASGLSDALRARMHTHTSNQDIFSYQASDVFGVELVSVKLRCYAQWNGPEVQATFQFPSDGMRSRLNNDTKVTVGNPLSLERLPAPDSWQQAGVSQYPVIRIPVSIFVDHPWPADNHKVSFMLVLSGMYGFGATASSSIYEDYQVTND